MIGTGWLPIVTKPWAMAVAPWAILLGFVLLLAFPSSRWLAERLLSENRPVELLTFLLFVWAAILGVSIARQASKHGEHVITVSFYALFATLCFVVAMEEISWGQQFLPIETPEYLKEINVQGELTLHNFRGHNSALELFVFGIIGLVGVALSRIPALRTITPPAVMFSWFMAIALAGGADAFTDQSDQTRLPIYVVAWIGEVVEMMIAMASVTFLWLKRSELRGLWQSIASNSK